MCPAPDRSRKPGVQEKGDDEDRGACGPGDARLVRHVAMSSAASVRPSGGRGKATGLILNLDESRMPRKETKGDEAGLQPAGKARNDE